MATTRANRQKTPAKATTKQQSMLRRATKSYLIPIMFILIIGIVGYQAVNSVAAATTLPFGLFKSTNNDQYSFPSVPKYAIQYYGWQEGFQTADADAAWKAGTEVYAEMQTCGNPCDTTGVPISGVTNGTYDAYLTSFAKSIKAFGHPVLLTFDHEMNGSWYPWGDTKVTPTQWIAAWQHVAAVMRTYAPNANTVWAPNIEEGAAPVANYWPGKGYPAARVGVIGLDGYYQNTGSNWSNTFAKSVTDLKKVGGSRTFMITETGVPSTDSNDVSQIDNLIAGARSAKAASVMYFDSSTKWTFTSKGQAEFVKDVK